MSIKCPKCQHEKSDVFDSRPRDDGIRRRRTCRKCQNRFTTQEKVLIPSYALKKKAPPKPTNQNLPKPPKAKKAPRRPSYRSPTPDFNAMSDDDLESYIYGDRPPFPDGFGDDFD
jgi:hypothetical protein